MDAAPGEPVSIVGSNGAGKTMLLSRTADEPLANASSNDFFNWPMDAL